MSCCTVPRRVGRPVVGVAALILLTSCGGGPTDECASGCPPGFVCYYGSCVIFADSDAFTDPGAEVPDGLDGTDADADAPVESGPEADAESAGEVDADALVDLPEETWADADADAEPDEGADADGDPPADAVEGTDDGSDPDEVEPEDAAPDEAAADEASPDTEPEFETVRVECEDGTVFGAMAPILDADAFGGSAVYAPAGTPSVSWGSTPPPDRVEIPVDLVRGGTYRAWVRVLARSGSEDAQYFAFDGVSPLRFWSLDHGSYQWRGASGNGDGTPFEVTATPGRHLVFVALGEPEVRCDRVLLTTDLTFVPTEAP